MPMTFTAGKTRSGVEFVRVVASGRVSIEEVLSLDRVVAKGPLLGVVDPNADFLAEVREVASIMREQQQPRAAIIVNNAPLRAMLAFASRISNRSTTRFFSKEEYALAWLDESPSPREEAA
jgi:hypothetical protein